MSDGNADLEADTMSKGEFTGSPYAKCPQCDHYLIAEARAAYERGIGWCQHCGWEQDPVPCPAVGAGQPKETR